MNGSMCREFEGGNSRDIWHVWEGLGMRTEREKVDGG